MYIYPSGARLKIRWSGRKWDRCEILDDRWEETAKEEKRRRTTVDRAVRELAESFRIRIGEKGGLKVGRAVPRLTKHTKRDSLETDLHRSLRCPPATSTASSRFCATWRHAKQTVD